MSWPLIGPVRDRNSKRAGLGIIRPWLMVAQPRLRGKSPAFSRVACFVAGQRTRISMNALWRSGRGDAMPFPRSLLTRGASL